MRDAAASGGPERGGTARARGHFMQGFVGLLPLWAGAIPAGLAYGVAAGGAGLSPAEAQLMSVVVFSAAAQVSAAALTDCPPKRKIAARNIELKIFIDKFVCCEIIPILANLKSSIK